MRSGHTQIPLSMHIPEDGMWLPKGGKLKNSHMHKPPKYKENELQEEEDEASSVTLCKSQSVMMTMKHFSLTL